MASLLWTQVSAFRLRRHYLVSRAEPGSLVEVTQALCGVQAQLMTAAQVALGARVRHLVLGDVESALWQTRALVKTWCMRGTVHLLPAQDLPIYTSALKGSGTREVQRWLSKYGVSQDEINVMTAAIVEALATGPLTRRELAERVVSLLGEKARPWIEHSWGGVSKQAALQGLICYGPDRGQEVTFVRLDQWLPALGEMPEEKAGSALLRCYLRSYGPATLRDFAKWTGMTMKEAKLIRNRLGDEVGEVSIEGQMALILCQDIEQVQAETLGEQPLCLLPSFDPYMLGHHDKGHLVDQAYYKKVYRKAGWVSPVVLLGGRVIGVWSYKRRGGRLSLTVESFYSLSRAVCERIEAAAADIGRFLEATCEVTFEK
jgi:uncharacterized protein YcaQ